jgi:hypothetical protein
MIFDCRRYRQPIGKCLINAVPVNVKPAAKFLDNSVMRYGLSAMKESELGQLSVA